jgi:hypothetical protein
MATTPQDIRDRLVQTAEHCYYTGATAGQMWLHDLSAYLQQLPDDDPRFRRLVRSEQSLADAETYLCEQPHALAQAFRPSTWLDQFAERAAVR